MKPPNARPTPPNAKIGAPNARPTPAQRPPNGCPTPPNAGAQHHIGKPIYGGPSGDRPIPFPVSAQIEELASRVQRLMVSRRDPESFFCERSDIAGEMRRLARAVRQ